MTDGDLTIDEMEALVRSRVERIDAEIRVAREQRAALMVEIKRLNVERVKASRMLPRTPRTRKTGPTTTKVSPTPTG